MAVDFDYSMLDAMDILDLAVFVEKEAEESYEQLASWAGTGNPETSRFFKQMARFEAGHGAQIAARRHELFGDTPPKYTDTAPWDVETPDYDKVGPSMSMQEAFAISLAAEQRAAQYYRTVIEYISDPMTVQLLEALRDAEIEHERLIREEMERHGSA